MVTPGRNIMTNADSILKSRDITLPSKVHLVKAMVFPVVMHGCESWTIKKTEHRRIDAFELWCWRRLLRESPLDCKEIQPVHPKGNQSWIFNGRTVVMDREAWRAAIHGVSKSRTWLSNWTELSTEELMLLNSGVGEDSQDSLGLQEDPTSPS